MKMLLFLSLGAAIGMFTTALCVAAARDLPIDGYSWTVSRR